MFEDKTVLIPLRTKRGTRFINPSQIVDVDLYSVINDLDDPIVINCTITLKMGDGSSVETFARQGTMAELQALDSYFQTYDGTSFVASLDALVRRTLLQAWIEGLKEADKASCGLKFIWLEGKSESLSHEEVRLRLAKEEPPEGWDS